MKRFVLALCLIAMLLYSLSVPINSQNFSDTYLQDISINSANLSRIQRANATFHLYKTHNFSTFLLLDTRDGRVWQLHWAINNKGYNGLNTLNPESLATQNDENIGRFTLYPTTNFGIYILLDQETGRTWLCQFSVDKPEFRFIRPLSTARHY